MTFRLEITPNFDKSENRLGRVVTGTMRNNKRSSAKNAYLSSLPLLNTPWMLGLDLVAIVNVSMVTTKRRGERG